MESNRKDKKVEQARDIAIAVAFTAGPFGFGVPILYSCISWAVAWVAFVHLILNLEHLSRVSNRTKSGGTLIVSAILAWVSYSPIRMAYIKEKARATSGDLLARSDGIDHSSDKPAIQMGPNGTTLVWTGSPIPPVVAYYDKIDVKMIDGRVRLTTSVHDDNKNLIVEITDNHWIVSSSTAVCWDKNYTDDSLEVKDGHGRVVLQVRLLPSTVQIQEEWQSNPAWPVNPNMKSGGMFQQGKRDEKNGIKPMFKYPSEVYWGQLEPGPY